MRYYGTFGPSCHENKELEALIQLGMTGIRFNLSHGDLSERMDWLCALKEAEEKSGKRIEFLMDLCGPEMRIADLKCDAAPRKGEAFFLYAKEGKVLNREKPSCTVPEVLLLELKERDRLSLNDGSVILSVVGSMDGIMQRCEVIQGGLLESGKSISLLGRELSLPPLSDSDCRNLNAARTFGVTAVMQSFAGSGADVMNLRRQMNVLGLSDVKIFAKIETPRGVQNMEEIITHADEVVIARGDLGNTMGLKAVPAVQKQISLCCRRQKKPFMVVTELLKSMIKNPTPTQAEVSDITHAVWSGASSLMLTGETAVGAYPEEAMRRLIEISEYAILSMEESKEA